MKFFISYVVVTGSQTNSFGHSYLVFSKLDESLGLDAQPEVFEATGLYGDPHNPDSTWYKKIFPAKLFGAGHLKQEHLRYFVEGNGYLHHHKTWAITESQLKTLLDGIGADRKEPLAPRDFKYEYSYWQSLKSLRSSQERTLMEACRQKEEAETRNTAGPYFNIIKYDCMTDAKLRLNSVGINTSQLEGYPIDIPSWSGSLDRLKLHYENGRVFWFNPLVTFPRTYYLAPDEDSTQIESIAAFNVLLQGINGLLDSFDKKVQSLSKNKPCKALATAVAELQNLKKEMERVAPYPFKITPLNNATFEDDLLHILVSCHDDLKRTKSPLIIFFIQTFDLLYEFFMHAKAFLLRQKVELNLSAFSLIEHSHAQVHTWLDSKPLRDKMERPR